MFSSVAVFCGSSYGDDPIYAFHAKELGELLGFKNITLVYGGGNTGLMGEVANAALSKGGKVIGIIPEMLKDRERHHKGITELHIVADMHTRKKRMYELCDAAIILPGGNGTMDEMFEMLTLIQTKKVAPIKIILVNKKFWKPMISWIEKTIYKENKAIGKADLNLFHLVNNADEAMELVHKMVRQKKLGHVSRESDTLEHNPEGVVMPRKRISRTTKRVRKMIID